MNIININETDAQTFSITINDANYNFRLLDRGDKGVFLDVYKSGTLLLGSLLCLDRVRIIRSAYKIFPGDLMFADQNGFSPPTFSGFNTRFLLYYLEPETDNHIGL